MTSWPTSRPSATRSATCRRTPEFSSPDHGGVVSNDVVITGMGATTPLGGDVMSTWEAMLAGRSGVSTIDAEWIDRFELPVRIAASLAVEPTEVLPRVEARRLDRCEQVAVVAARQA